MLCLQSCLLCLVRSGRAAARGAANPAARVPGRHGRRDLRRGAGEIGLGLARGGGGRRGGAGGGGGEGERKERDLSSGIKLTPEWG